MSDNPAISVMIPVYNTERFVEATIRSILSQTFSDFQLIVIDDGSTDRSPQLLRQLADSDRRIRLLCRENRGIVATRNELLALAKGEFLAVNDSDDLSQPTRLAKQIDYLRTHPEVVCVGSWFDLIDEFGSLLRELRPPTDHKQIQTIALTGASPMVHSSALIRRRAIEQVGGYTPELKQAEDLDLWLKLGEVGRIANIPESLVQFRLHARSISQTQSLEQREFARLACQAAWKRRGIQGTFTADKPWRPGEDRQSRHEYAMRYGWWAFRSGRRRTALGYGLQAVRLHPFKLGGWKIAYCSIFRPIPPDPRPHE